ncbi:MAG TPA: DNA polymerase I [Candidatus Methylomirabilis sp.]|nr:DNA polymerase I [Candidatus Methylomirabilis sp.]
MPSKRPKLLLLDANALLHRAWHALPPLTSPDGKVVNAAYGVTSVVLKILRDEKPDLFVACWDTAAPTFRHEAYEAYKAQREEQPDELYDQIPATKEVLRTLGVPSVELDGFEADDLIGTYAVRGVKDGYDVRIVTGDRDALQLIAPHVDVLTFKKGVSETRLFTDKEVMDDYGIAPKQLVDWKALRGDASDNIPGVPGIGEKTATELLKKFRTIEDVFKAAHDATSDLPDGVRKKLIAGEKNGRLALSLVDIKTDVPVQVKIADLRSSLDRDAFIQAAAKYGFRSLITRLPQEGRDQDEPPVRAGARPAGVGKRSRKKISPDAATATFAGEEDALSFIADVRCAEEVALVVTAGTQGSLFGSSSLQNITFGLAGKKGTIPSSLFSSKSVRRELADILSLERPGKLCHDAKRAMKELEISGFGLAGVVHDTLIAAHLLAAGERSLDLETLTLQSLGRQLPQGDARPAAEAQAVLELTVRQREEMAATGADRVWERFERPLLPILRDMERSGVLIDSLYLKKLSKEMQEEKVKIEKQMERLVGHAFNPASPSQLAVILFEELKLPTKGIKSGKTGFSTAASELEKLQGGHPLISLIVEHRELAKLLSTYVETLPELADKGGRIHTTFNQAIAATGRLSSSEPNLQNIPIRTELGRKIRRAFIADPGMELLSCDYSQIELRVIAALAKDEKMLSAFRSGQDIHTATAAAIWNIPPGEVTKDQRRAAKAINFGIIYGQGPVGLAQSADIPFADAKKFIAAYFDTYQGVKTWLDETKAKAHALGYVETMFGRRRPIPDINSGMPQLRAAAERMAINMPVQGTGTGDLIKLALIALADKLPSLSRDSRLLLQVHDEVLLEVPVKDVVKVAHAVRDIMENVEDIGVPIVVEAKHGRNWEEMKKV